MVTLYKNGHTVPWGPDPLMAGIRPMRNEARLGFETLEDLASRAEVDIVAESMRNYLKVVSRRRGELLAFGYIHEAKGIEIAAAILAVEHLKITDADRELVAAASAQIGRVYRKRRHHIAAAALGTSGLCYISANLGTAIPGHSICAEAIVLGNALSHGDAVKTIVAVKLLEDGTAKVVPPCGECKDRFMNFGVKEVILQEEGHLYKLPPHCVVDPYRCPNPGCSAELQEGGETSWN